MDVINDSVNQSLNNANLGQISNILSYVPRTLSEKIAELLTSNNFVVTPRWVSGVFILFSLIMFYVSIKLLEKVNWLIKALIIGLALLLLAGLFLVPGW